MKELSDVKEKLMKIDGKLDINSTHLEEMSQLQRTSLTSEERAYLTTQQTTLTTQQAALTTQQATLASIYTELLHERARLDAEVKEERLRREAKEAASLAPPPG